MWKLILLLGVSFLASATNFFVDNSCSNNGNGQGQTCAASGGGVGPYNSAVNVSAGSYAAGNSIFLKRGQTYRELMTIGGSGAVGNPVIIDAWGTGALPNINGASAVTGWSSYSTSNTDAVCATHTYQATMAKAATPSYAWRSGLQITQGSGQDALTDQQWFWLANVLYVCDSAGNPSAAGTLIEASLRSNGILGVSRSNVTIQNVTVSHTESYAIRASTTSTNWIVKNSTAFQVSAAAQITAAANYLLDHFTLREGYSTTGGVVIDGSSASSVTVSQYACLVSKYCLTVTNTNASTTVAVNGCLWDQYSTTPLQFSATGAVTVSNCVVPGTTTATPAETFKGSTAGTLSVDYSLVLPDAQNTAKAMFSGSAVIEGTHNVFDDPQWTSTARVGIFGRTVDDGPDCADWLTLNVNADRYGLGTTLAFSQTERIPQNFLCGSGSNAAIIQAQVNHGHDIVSHTRYHSNVGYNNVCCWILFNGTATTATMTISSGHVLTTFINGVLDLTINLAQTNLGSPPTQLRESDLCQGSFASGASVVTSALSDLSSYSCLQAEPQFHSSQDFNDKVVMTRALPVSGVDINHTTASSAMTALTNVIVSEPGYGVLFDADAVQTDELTTSSADIAAVLKAPNTTSTPYPVNGFNYPGGYYTCQLCTVQPIQRLINAGILGARADGMQATGRVTSNMNMYVMSTGFSTDGKQYQLSYEQSCSDTTTAYNFTCSGLTYSTDHVRQIYSGKFNGSAYAFKTSTPTVPLFLDLHRGDFMFRAWLKPTTLSATHTVVQYIKDDGNYLWVYLQADGTVVLSIVAGGIETAHIATPAGAILAGVDGGAGAFQELIVWKRRGVFHIQVNAVEIATVASTVNPGNYSGGGAYWGSSFFGGVPQNGYVGLMDDSAASLEGYLRSVSGFLGLTQLGAVQMDLSHGESPGPSVLYRNVFEVARAFTGNTKWLTMSAAINYLRSKGTMQADNQTLVWNQPDASNYRPRMGSPVCGAGTAPISTTDMDGLPYLRNDIGIYRCAPKAAFGGVM